MYAIWARCTFVIRRKRGCVKCLLMSPYSMIAKHLTRRRQHRQQNPHRHSCLGCTIESTAPLTAKLDTSESSPCFDLRRVRREFAPTKHKLLYLCSCHDISCHALAAQKSYIGQDLIMEERNETQSLKRLITCIYRSTTCRLRGLRRVRAHTATVSP